MEKKKNGRPLKTEKTIPDVKISIRYKPEEKQELDALCEELGTTVTTFIKHSSLFNSRKIRTINPAKLLKELENYNRELHQTSENVNESAKLILASEAFKDSDLRLFNENISEYLQLKNKSLKAIRKIMLKMIIPE